MAVGGRSSWHALSSPIHWQTQCQGQIFEECISVHDGKKIMLTSGRRKANDFFKVTSLHIDCQCFLTNLPIINQLAQRKSREAICSTVCVAWRICNSGKPTANELLRVSIFAIPRYTFAHTITRLNIEALTLTSDASWLFGERMILMVTELPTSAPMARMVLCYSDSMCASTHFLS